MNTDRFRRDGRTTGCVSLTRAIKSTILLMREGWITLVDFDEPIWYAEFKNIPRNKPLWFCLVKNEKFWVLIDYLENEEDIVRIKQ